jgi:hypothetical protein
LIQNHISSIVPHLPSKDSEMSAPETPETPEASETSETSETPKVMMNEKQRSMLSILGQLEHFADQAEQSNTQAMDDSNDQFLSAQVDPHGLHDVDVAQVPEASEAPEVAENVMDADDAKEPRQEKPQGGAEYEIEDESGFLPHDETSGRGSEENNGNGRQLYDSELMSMLKNQPLFAGVIMRNELPGLLRRAISTIGRKFGFIMNTDKESDPGNGTHWVSIWVDLDPRGGQTISYYDSLNDPPKKEVVEYLRVFARAYSPSRKVKFKTNDVVHQQAGSNRCGYFAVRFIQKMARSDGDFASSSSFDQALSESNMRKAEDQFRRFGYI